MEVLSIRQDIVKWLKNYLLKNKKDGFVIGMSGGIDSSVLTLLAKEAVDEINKGILALVLPINNDYYDEKTAIFICKKFNVEYKTINLASNYESLKNILSDTSVVQPVSYTNLKARLRSTVLYFHANQTNYLVLGTVNKGEFTIGYFPKNASAGDMLPMADLLKKEIREIAESYGLPKEIVNSKASGCIWAKTAEEEWGFTEEELDKMLETIDKDENALYKLKDIPKEKVKKFLEAYHKSAHKRCFYPMYKKQKK